MYTRCYCLVYYTLTISKKSFQLQRKQSIELYTVSKYIYSKGNLILNRVREFSRDGLCVCTYGIISLILGTVSSYSSVPPTCSTNHTGDSIVFDITY